MPTFHIVRDIALRALDDSEDEDPDALTAFHKMADPRTVLELIELAETSLASDEMKPFVQLIRDMASYIEKVSDVNGTAKPLEQKDLLFRFNQLREVAGL